MFEFSDRRARLIRSYANTNSEGRSLTMINLLKSKVWEEREVLSNRVPQTLDQHKAREAVRGILSQSMFILRRAEGRAMRRSYHGSGRVVLIEG